MYWMVAVGKEGKFGVEKQSLSWQCFITVNIFNRERKKILGTEREVKMTMESSTNISSETWEMDRCG